MESIGQPFNTSVAFGSESQVTLNRNGDLLFYQYIVVDLPAITACDKDDPSCAGIAPGQFPSCAAPCAPCKSTDESLAYDPYLEDNFSAAGSAERDEMMDRAKARWTRANMGGCMPAAECAEAEDCPDSLLPSLGGVWAHWTNAIGFALLRNVRLVIGGSTVDQLFSDYMFAFEELSGKAGRRLSEIIGKRFSRSQLICDSRQKRLLYIPLGFFYTLNSGMALSLASLQFHSVMLQVEWSPLNKLIVTSGPNVVVRSCGTGNTLTNTDLSACVESTYVYLDDAERSRFATTHFEVLITQVQTYQTTHTGSQVRLNLNLNHPIIELIWMIRRSCNEKCNAWTNYSGVAGTDPMIHSSLYLNNQARWANKSAVYHRIIQPMQHHNNVPDCFIYCYSFALHAEDAVPSGTCNFSRIDHVDLILQCQEGLGPFTVLLFGRNFNILRFREGLGGLAYAN